MPIVQLALSLAQFAPSLMRFFGAGEASAAVAEKVVGIAGAVTGATDPAEILGRLRENAQLAQQFRLAVLNADTELEKAFLADRQDARARDVEVRKLNSGNNRRADVMILGAVAGLLACLVVLVFFRKDIPGEVVGIVSTIAGIFGACLRDAFQFEFGSSRGSKEKDEVISGIVSGYQPRPAATPLPPPRDSAGPAPRTGVEEARPF